MVFTVLQTTANARITEQESCSNLTMSIRKASPCTVCYVESIQIVSVSPQVSENKVTYTNVLTYSLGPGLYPITEPVECVYDV